MNMRKHLPLLLALCASIASPATALADDASWTRLSGSNRYETCETIVNEGFASSGYAVVATGENYPDALAAASLAGARGCPVVLTERSALSQEAARELMRLHVSHAYVMGGTQTLPEAVEFQIRSLGITCERIAGSNRAQTSLAAMRATRGIDGVPDSVIITTGATFADSLSIGSWAWASHSPIVLAESDGRLSDEAVQAIVADRRISHVIIVGGEASVSDDVRAQLGAGYHFERLSGDDRYDTSARVAAWVTSHGLSWQGATIATGEGFADALAGASFAGTRGAALLLTKRGVEQTNEYLFEHRESITHGYILGGTASVHYDNPTLVIGRPLADADESQRALVHAAETTPFAGGGWCAAWVEYVYENAGRGTFFGDARDLYDTYCTSSDPADLMPGMIVAVSSHPHTNLGSIYGHVGIYVGDGWIMDNASTRVRHVPLVTWLDMYGATVTPRWGWMG